ncbi:maleylpyruvate isomerase family mycothiol-dependent enzyme [Mycolicibacterium aubagnense]|uniref:Mycothiol-dependent maleylpyruvate isomerase metal-binding domain-containing protein n=1 Tax=Mycolicibacterium aubagnense TaxID=319707 RepID=A0ABM7IJ93_9MYCO|nr:maleylpyruvate isomerase family mycothiol-dependent enzyme [Mycolicibacterium aubagnense]TLH66745.1 hypothetical protein C1S80_06660 [Mycolicibacterium aubagnense]WGI31664.1 maleylpyruvate isomerase family mycothiol-dependent enzyme [Mycolicibacterium aubagnense]BBX86856.1 hypothetical protein MAUB_47290 [Mycolicibacterium aubagnense]
MLDTAYRLARRRIAELALALSADQFAIPVPATPGWTVHDLLTHLVGGAADITNGRLDVAGSDQWTELHVRERRTRSIDELLAEWHRVGPTVETSLTNPTFTGPNLAADAICHEADLHEALGLDRVDREHWQPFLDTMMRLMHRRSQGSTAMVIHDENDRQWHCGAGEPTLLLRADGYELLRGAYSRRSRRQIAAWDWTPAPPPHIVEHFGHFGPRDDDQPIPNTVA